MRVFQRRSMTQRYELTVYVRVAGVGSRRADRGDRAAGQPLPDRYDRAGVPPSDRSRGAEVMDRIFG